MSNPTSGWDPVPVTGKWLNIDGTNKTGAIRFTLSQRVITTAGTAIYPQGGSITVALGTETGSIATNFPGSDDPDIAPTGWKVKVEEQLTDGSGQTYYIEPKLADLPNGVNLNLVVVPSNAPATPPPVYMRGVAGGLAALNAAGQVIDAAGNPLTVGAAAALSTLSDVDMTGLADGVAPIWNATTSKWEAGTVAAGAIALGGLTDVDTTGATTGQVLGYDGTNWGPETVAAGGGSVTINGSTGTTFTLATSAQGSKADTAVQKVNGNAPDGAGNVVVSVAAGDVTGVSSLGVGLMTAASSAAARTLTGAGTSDLALGTTSTTALRGDTAILALGTTSTTALRGNTTAASIGGLQLGATSTTALRGDTSIPAAETGGSIRTLLGITTLSGSNTGDQTTITGNAATATKLATARTINGVSFNGSGNITVADATKASATTTVNGHALSSNVTISASDLSTGTLDVARLDSSVSLVVKYSGASWPARPTASASVSVLWLGPTAIASPSVVTSGTSGMYEGDRRGKY